MACLSPAQLEDSEWIDSVVQGEDIVQREDMHMCDLVQSGLTSPAYDVGRWAAPLLLLTTEDSLMMVTPPLSTMLCKSALLPGGCCDESAKHTNCRSACATLAFETAVG